MKRSPWRLLPALTLLASGLQARAQEAVWIEGEAPASANVKLNLAGWGHKDFLSGEKWLHLSVDADKLAATVPPEGALIRYTFEVEQPADYEVWNRVGFEWVRSPFRWRIDDADWADASPETPTTDLMEIDFFCEVAWLKLGRRPLKAGPHTLEIRLDRTKDKDGKPQRILYASDALVLHPGHFQPTASSLPAPTAATTRTERPPRRASRCRHSRRTAARPPSR